MAPIVPSQGQQSFTPEIVAEPIRVNPELADEIARAIKGDSFFNGLREVHASAEVVRKRAHDCLDSALDEMGIPRPEHPKSLAHRAKEAGMRAGEIVQKLLR